MGVPGDLDPGLLREREQVVLLIKKGRSGVVLPTVGSCGPGYDNKLITGRRAIKDQHAHSPKEDRLLVESKRARAIKRRP